MRYFFIILMGMMVLGACKKDKFQTKPSLRIVSTNTHEVPIGGSLVVTLEYTDKQGDLSDSIFVRKIRTNRRTTPTVRDSVWYALPVFPDATKAEVVLNLSYSNIQSAIAPPNVIGSNPPRKESDSLTLKFVIQDKDKNKSDTVTLSDIIVLRS